jgi:hypothetical protein
MAGAHSARGSGRPISAGTGLPAAGDSRLQGNRGLEAPGDPYYLEVGWITAPGLGALVGTVADRRSQRVVTHRSNSRAGAGKAADRPRRYPPPSAFSTNSEPRAPSRRARGHRRTGSSDGMTWPNAEPLTARDPQNGESRGTRSLQDLPGEPAGPRAGADLEELACPAPRHSPRSRSARRIARESGRNLTVRGGLLGPASGPARLRSARAAGSRARLGLAELGPGTLTARRPPDGAGRRGMAAEGGRRPIPQFLADQPTYQVLIF